MLNHCQVFQFLQYLFFTYFRREEVLIIQLILNPSHEVVYVLWGRALDGLLHSLAICPVVLVLGPRRHYGAALLGTELCDGPVQHVDLIEEIHSWKM